MLKDRQPPPHLNKTNWIAKTAKNILRIDVQYPLQEENNHYICWKKFRKELKKKLNNQGLDIHIWIVDKNDHINVPKNLEWFYVIFTLFTHIYYNKYNIEFC